MESEIKRRLKEFITAKGITVRGFEKSLGRSNGYFKNSEFALPKLIGEIADAYPELNIGWLISGDGSMDKGKAVYVAETVPIVNMFALGGSLTEQLDSASVDELESVQTPVKGAEMAIEVSGDSMAPKYPSGSRLFCRHVDDPTFIEWGKVYVLDTKNGAVVKELRPGSSHESIMCHSLNDSNKYVPFEVPFSSVYGIWKVIAGLVIE